MFGQSSPGIDGDFDGPGKWIPLLTAHPDPISENKNGQKIGVEKA